MAEYEQTIEAKRVQLAKLPEFEPFEAFTRFTESKAEFIEAQDFERFMLTSPNLKEQGQLVERLTTGCGPLIRFFDATNQDCINYQE